VSPDRAISRDAESNREEEESNQQRRRE